MKRLKIMGAAFATALVLTAVIGTASAAANAGFWADEYPASIEEKIYPTLKVGQSITCSSGSTLSASLAGGGSLETSLTNPTCVFINATQLKFNGCKLIFRGGATAGEGTYDIGPAGCGPIRYENSECDATIESQTGLKAEYVTSGSGSSTKTRVKAVGTNMKYTLNKGSFWCGSKGVHTDGGITFDTELIARNGAGTQIGLHEDSIGLFMSDVAFPAFSAEHYSVPASGSLPESLMLKAEPIEIKCPKSTFTSEGLLGPSYGATVVPQLTTCNWGGLGTQVNMNGCTGFLGVNPESTPASYFGGFDIRCPAGKAVEILRLSGGATVCTMTITPQELGSGVTYSTTGSGVTRGISATFNASGIKYSLAGGKVGCDFLPREAYENGTLTGTVSAFSF